MNEHSVNRKFERVFIYWKLFTQIRQEQLLKNQLSISVSWFYLRLFWFTCGLEDLLAIRGIYLRSWSFTCDLADLLAIWEIYLRSESFTCVPVILLAQLYKITRFIGIKKAPLNAMLSLEAMKNRWSDHSIPSSVYRQWKHHSTAGWCSAFSFKC